MAKLHNYYVLCPLIDQKSFLGVAKDKEDEHVIVTLGRNVVNKYRLSDQKQIGGWTSKDHITSTVIFDQQQENYVGIFNKNTIKMWSEDSENLDKVKKYKFPINIFKLIPLDHQSPLLIFCNGNCASLPYAIENRKTYENKSLIKETDQILDIACYTIDNVNHICYIVKTSRDAYEILDCSIREELGDLERSKLSKVKVTRQEDVYVVGVMIGVEKQAVYVLWNDSKMTYYDLNKKSWATIGTVPWISTFSSVSMAWMGKNHLILFGSNIDQDGAIIVAYNIVLGVGSCRYPMKMYSEDAKLYCLYGRIILEASNHIGMLPYVLETKRNLSSLLGSHEVIQDESMEIANWDSSATPILKVNDEIKELLKLGLTERSICAQIIPIHLEKEDFRSVFKVIKEFRDIPESVLVLLLNYAIKLVNPTNADVDNFTDLFSQEFDSKKELIIHKAKFELLNHLLQISFSDALLIPHLRNGMPLNDTLYLMSYISYLLNESDKKMTTEYESKLFDWCTLLMDAFYQQYLMTKDEKVTRVLQNMLDVVNNLVRQLIAVDNTMPLLNKFVSGKCMEESDDTISYAIELMQI